MRVLVVEDEFLIAMELQETLERLGIEVVGPVGRLAEAIASAATENLDGALLDVNLSTGTSAEIAKTLQMRGIPFIFITGYDHNTLSADLDSAPRLAKPLDECRLRGALEGFASAG